MKKIFYTLSALILFVVAFTQVSLACGSMGYQPKVPEKLLK